MCTTQPIDIPVNKRSIQVNEKIVFELKTGSGDILVVPCSVHNDLITGFVTNTPPQSKHYKKGDKVMFHKHNVINMT